MLLAVLAWTATAAAAPQDTPFQPEVGQPGKDVVWVPTPPAMVEKMLDLAQVGPGDFVIDLGSGDGRNVIGAARRGARALGVEYNTDLVELSRRKAQEAGVADRALFERGDMFVADISKASVMALFLLPSNLLQLRPKLLSLRPGSRIVSNTFLIEGWPPDANERVGGACEEWCEAYLWIVPARVEGRWRLSNGELTLTQNYQKLTGTWTRGGTPASLTGSLRGADMTITADGRDWRGGAAGDTLTLTAPDGSSISAMRIRP
jgi:SAM-dependent methyltransferase